MNFNLKNHKFGDCYISYKNKFIYINIPKCASTSLKEIVIKSSAKQSNFVKIPSNQLDSFFKFCFLRNPISRFESAFYEIIDRGLMHKNSRIEDLVSSIKKNGFWDEHILPQVKFIDGMNMDFIGVVENIRSDLQYIESIAKIHNTTIPHLNKTKIKRLPKKQIDKIIPFIQQEYAEDFILWENSSM